MAVERLLGTANLLAVATQGAIAPDNRMLGYNWRTDLANKQVVAGYVKMPPAATTFVSGTKWQIWKRASPISTSTLVQNIEIGGGVVTGTAGSEQLVPGVANTVLVQNDFYFVTLYHPNTQPGDYWFQSGGGNPANGSLSGNCIFKNGSASTVPPDDETFTNGRFAVDVAIDDISSDISVTLNINLPPLSSSLAVEPPIDVTLNLVQPPLSSSLSVSESVLYANLREYVWNTLKGDAILNSYGINGDSIIAANSADSPAATLRRWVILRWAIEDAPMGRDTTSRRRPLTIWAYDRERDYTHIDLILQRCQQVLYPVKAVKYASDGWITQVERGNTSDDLYDPAYDAVSRSWELTIVASGL